MSYRVKSVSHRDILESSPSPSRTQLDCEQEVEARTVSVLKTVQYLLVVISRGGRGRSSYLVALAFWSLTTSDWLMLMDTRLC